MTVKPGMPVTRQAADEALTETTGVSFVTVPAVNDPVPDDATNGNVVEY